MKVKYEGRRYTVSFADKLQIEVEKNKLFFKRQFRRLKLLFAKETILLYLLISSLWVLFGVIIYLWGNVRSSQTYSLSDLLWETKNGFFTSVVISLFVGAYNKVRDYKTAIRKQDYFYVDTMRDFQKIFIPLLRKEIQHYHPLYCNQCLEDTIQFLKMNNVRCVNVMGEEYSLALSAIKKRIDTIEEMLRAENIIGTNESRVSYYLYSARGMIDSFFLKKTVELSEITKLAGCLLNVLDQIRVPWRRDIAAKIKILRLLDKCPDNNIKQDFYYGMLLQGHDFTYDR